MVIPIFAAAANKKGQSLTKAAVIFSAGLFISLLPMALGALLFNQLFNLYRQPISLFVGVLLIIWGIIILLGHQLPLPDLGQKIAGQKSLTRFGSVFSLGLIAGLGATTCVGPILGAILSLAASSPGSLTVISLMIAYAAGLIIPLIIISMLVSKNANVIQKATHRYYITIRNKKVLFTEIATGALLILIGYIFIRYQGTLTTIPIINRSGILNASFDLQDALFLLQ